MARHPLARKVDDLLDVGWDGLLPVNVDELCRVMQVHVADHDSACSTMRLVVEGELALILVPDNLHPITRRLHVAYLLARYLGGETRHDLPPGAFRADRLLADPVALAGYCAAAHMLVPKVALEFLLAEGERAACVAEMAARLQVGEPLLHHRLAATGLLGSIRLDWTLLEGQPARLQLARGVA